MHAEADRNGLLRRGPTVTVEKEKADISTLEKTGHLYFAPTRAKTQLVCCVFSLLVRRNSAPFQQPDPPNSHGGDATQGPTDG